MKLKHSFISITLAALIILSLYAVVSTTSVSGATMAGTGPAVSTRWQTTHTDVFAVGTGETLWFMPGGSSTWESLGGVSTASPAATSWGFSDRIDVFVRGANGALYHKWYDGGWSGWEKLGGVIYPGTGPTVCSWSAGRLDVFVKGMNGALYHKWFQDGWSGWENLGGYLTSSPAAASPYSTTKIDVFVRGGDGAVWYKQWNGGAWVSWKSLGGVIYPNTGPAVSWASSNLFVQGMDHRLWWRYPSGGWTSGGWSRIGMPPEALAASSPASTNTYVMMHSVVCVSTISGNIWWSDETLTNWAHWYLVGSPP